MAQAPKMVSYLSSMRDILATDLKTNIANISIKATTTEKLGFTGRGEGIAVLTSVLITD